MATSAAKPMSKSESKYFNTAVKMDKALLTLLEKKDFAYITVKEICAQAGVNRSTFYLHYETMADLLSESTAYLNEQFLSHMQQDEAAFLSGIHTSPLQELYLVTPRYLTPYLQYVRENRRLFLAALKNAKALQLEQSYDKMMQFVFLPILQRHQVSAEVGKYMMAFYVQGLMAIITQWLKGGCREDIDTIIHIMQLCASGEDA